MAPSKPKFKSPAKAKALSKVKASTTIGSENASVVLTEFPIFPKLPIELQLMVWRQCHFARTVSLKPSKSQLPPLLLTSDADIEEYLKRTLDPSQYHPVGTCPKIPLELGGVVDEKLRVYGVEGLSVVDASIMPLIVGATTQLTGYAVAEKAADLIKARA